MGIKMNPPQFSDQRRQDPKRGRRGSGVRCPADPRPRGLRPLRIPVPPGRQAGRLPPLGDLPRAFRRPGQGWHLRDGSERPVAAAHPRRGPGEGLVSPGGGGRRLHGTEGWNAEGHDLREFRRGLVVFTDMERNEEIEHMAWERYHVSVIWGLDSLEQDLQRIAEEVDFRRPPNSWVSEKEWRMVYQLQSGEAPGRRDAGRHVQEVNRQPAAGGETERQVDLGSATFNIQHLDRLIVLYYPPERDGDGQLLLPEV